MRLLQVIGSVMALGALIAPPSFAGGHPAIVGDWETIDHSNNQPSSIIRIWESNGKFYGKIFKTYEPAADKTLARCLKCRGAAYNHPIVGLTIIRDLVWENGRYVNGRILDPRSGNDYHCYVRLSPDGRALNIRGYLGITLLGRTDTWERVIVSAFRSHD